MTTRRKFLTGALVGAAAGTIGRANAQTATQIRISTAAPPSDFLARALDQLKAELEGASVELNYGLEKLRFLTPVRVGRRIRGPRNPVR